MSKNKKRDKKKNSSTEIWTKEEYDEYMASVYGFEYIVGYTQSGVPYGITKEEGDMNGLNYDYYEDENLF